MRCWRSIAVVVMTAWPRSWICCSATVKMLTMMRVRLKWHSFEVTLWKLSKIGVQFQVKFCNTFIIKQDVTNSITGAWKHSQIITKWKLRMISSLKTSGHKICGRLWNEKTNLPSILRFLKHLVLLQYSPPKNVGRRQEEGSMQCMKTGIVFFVSDRCEIFEVFFNWINHRHLQLLDHRGLWY